MFINISKINYLLINHLMCTTPDTEQIIIFILHFLTIQKLKNVIYSRKFPCGRAYPSCFVHFILENKIKAASYLPILYFFNCQSQQFQINYI